MNRLHEIKAHPKYPFSRYRDDDESYLMSLLYWVELFKLATEGSPEGGRWKAWLRPSPDSDGSTMFSALSEARPRGVIINQYGPTPADVSYRHGGSYHPFVAWVDTLGVPAEPVIEHLTLNSEISDACEPLCRRLLHLWVVDGLPRDAMEDEIRRLDTELYG